MTLRKQDESGFQRAAVTLSERAKFGSMRLIARALAAGRLEVRVNGIENVPTEGPVLLVARHYHHLFDGLALFAAISRPLHIIVAIDWVETKLARRLLEFLTRAARWPVIVRRDALSRDDRSTASSGIFTVSEMARYERTALRSAVELLVEGRLLAIFPEGYPTIDPKFKAKTRSDEFLPFKGGFAAIASAAARRLRASLPIIPTGLRYESTDPWIAHLRFGKPVYVRTFTARAGLVRQVEAEVAKLSAPSE